MKRQTDLSAIKQLTDENQESPKISKQRLKAIFFFFF